MINKKKELRSIFRERIASMTPQEKSIESAAARDLIIKDPWWKEADAVFLFVPMVDREPDITPLIQTALAAGKTAALPYITPGTHRMSFKNITGEIYPDSIKAELHPFGFFQPSGNLPDANPLTYSSSLIITPGVAFTLQGERLGNGGGFYDRFFSGLGLTREICRVEHIRTLGAAFRVQLADALPVERYDIPVMRVISGGAGTMKD